MSKTVSNSTILCKLSQRDQHYFDKNKQGLPVSDGELIKI